MNKVNILDNISPYIYGTTRLGDDSIPFEERVAVAQAAMQSGVWFHTSRQYNSALEVLRAAFDSNRSGVPKLIIKMGGGTVEELIKDVKTNLDALAVDSLEIGQLCLWGKVADDLASGGSSILELQKLRESGLVKNFVLEVFPWSSAMPLKALQAGNIKGLIDAFIFYCNPLQRFASNELWDLIQAEKYPVIAMRTISGGPVHSLRDIPGFAWKQYLHDRAVEVAPIFERSGVASWTEFCVRYVHSISMVKATVGTSSKINRFNEFITSVNNLKPLPQNIMDEIAALQYRWSDETDVIAEPWSM
jgi:hypothetical protein